MEKHNLKIRIGEEEYVIIGTYSAPNRVRDAFLEGEPFSVSSDDGTEFIFNPP